MDVDTLFNAIDQYVYWACAEVRADMRQVDQGEGRRKEEAGRDLRDVLQKILEAQC